MVYVARVEVEEVSIFRAIHTDPVIPTLIVQLADWVTFIRLGNCHNRHIVAGRFTRCRCDVYVRHAHGSGSLDDGVWLLLLALVKP